MICLDGLAAFDLKVVEGKIQAVAELSKMCADGRGKTHAPNATACRGICLSSL